MDISKLKTINRKLLNMLIYSAFALPILSIFIHIYTERPTGAEDFLFPFLISFTCGFLPYLARYVTNMPVFYDEHIEWNGMMYKWEDVEYVGFYRFDFSSYYPKPFQIRFIPSLYFRTKKEGGLSIITKEFSYIPNNTKEEILRFRFIFSQVQKYNIDIYYRGSFGSSYFYSEEQRAEIFQHSEELEYVPSFILWEKILPCLYFCLLLGAIWTIYMGFYINMF